MDTTFSTMEKMVGAFVIGVAALLIATVIMIGRGKDWFEKYVTYYTTFNESYNLQENADVKLFKANIGKVVDITLEKNRVRVRLAILEKYASRIRQDAIAIVESPTLIGSEYISIIPGSSEAPLVVAGGEVASREKRSISDVLAEFEVEKTAKLVVKGIQDFSELTRMLGDTQGPLWQALKNFQDVSTHLSAVAADLDAGRGPAGALFRSETILAQLEQNLNQIDDILTNIDSVAQRTPDALSRIEEGVRVYNDAGLAFKARMDEVEGLFKAMKTAIASLQVILDNIKTGSYEVPEIATTFRNGIEEIRQEVEQVNRVVDSLQQNVFIRSNLSDQPVPKGIDAGARP